MLNGPPTDASPPRAAILSLLYRGTLESCNYTCSYCPFAKRKDSRARLQKDAAEVARFVHWVSTQQRSISVLFTPWGEALVRRHYRTAIQALSHMTQVHSVAVQTNLSAPLRWLEQVDARKTSLWCTYHPEQTTLERFLERCERLEQMGIAYSAGIVARREHYDSIRALRAALPENVYLWLNAYDRRGPGYYSENDSAWLEEIDPWFGFNRVPRPSFGAPCRTGSETLSVDGDGELQRCHFLHERIGNLYTDELNTLLRESPCSRARCACYIGYSQRRDLPIHADFGGAAAVLVRRPVSLVRKTG